MRRKICLFHTLGVLVLIAASLAPWAAWSPAASQAIEAKQVEFQPAGRDTVSLEIRKQLLAARVTDLASRRDAALVAREKQRAVEANNSIRKPESSPRKLVVAQEEMKLAKRVTGKTLTGI
jgi:hypothetical protein